MTFQPIPQSKIKELAELETLAMNTDTTFPYTESELEDLFSRGYMCFGLIDDSNIIIAKTGLEPVETGYELDIMVRPEYQNRGIGRSILIETLQWLQLNETAAQLILKVHPNNERAVHLYQSIGFDEIGQTTTDHGPRIIMQHSAQQ